MTIGICAVSTSKALAVRVASDITGCGNHRVVDAGFYKNIGHDQINRGTRCHLQYQEPNYCPFAF